MNSESYYKQCFNAFNKMLIISKTDANGVITGVNKNFCKISGFTEAELVGFLHNKIRHPDMKDAVFKNMWETISSGKIWKGEVKNYKKNRDFYWVKSVIFPIFDENKNIVEYISFREDITKRKKLEQKLKREDNFRREILHSLPDMVILVHKKKGVVFMNEQCFVHKAIICNKNGDQQIYNVRVSDFEENNNFTVVNFLNVTELESCKEDLNKNEETITLLKSKIKEGIATEGAEVDLLEELLSIIE